MVRSWAQCLSRAHVRVTHLPQDQEEAGLLELLKSQICDNAALYAQKYDEEFQPYLPSFVTAIWNLLVTTGREVKYDLVRLRPVQFGTFQMALVSQTFWVFNATL